MALTVLSVAYPLARVGPGAVGGAEQVVSRLDAALVAAGHRSIVVAREGSRVRGELVPTPVPEGGLTEEVCRGVRAAHAGIVREVLARERVDVVHMHGVDFCEYLPPPGAPTLVTLHLPPEWYPRWAFDLERPLTFLHCVSLAQQGRCPEGARLLPVIENGVEVKGGCGYRRREFAAALGRVCPEKNFHAAVDAAAEAGAPLILAGRVYPFPDHERYFAEVLRPRLTRERRFIGAVGPRARVRLLSSARCVLIPSLAPETSSLVAMEALACGTPVVAYRSGALPEIVEHGATGFLVDGPGAMAAAIGEVRRIDPGVCRAEARRRFGLSRMTGRYLEVYGALAGAARVGARRGAPERRQVRLEEVSRLEGLEALRGEWDGLWRRTPQATPMHRPQWLLPWWRHIGRAGRGELRVLAARDGGDAMVGLFPLYLYRQPGTRERALFPLGIATTDYLDPLLAPGWEAAAWQAALERLQGERERWDVLEWPQLRGGSPLGCRDLPGGWRGVYEAGEPCPVRPLPRTVEELWATLPGNVAQNLRYYRRRAERAGRVEFETAGAGTIEAVLAELARLHRARWESRGERGVLAAPGVARAQEETALGLAEQGLLRMCALKVGGRTAAVLYGMSDGRQGGTVYLYLMGMDPAAAAYSPGTLLIGHAMEEAVREGAGTFDFLRGRERYKYHWGATDTPVCRLVLRHGGAGFGSGPGERDRADARA